MSGVGPVRKYAGFFGSRLAALHAKGNLVSKIGNDKEDPCACAENVLVCFKRILVFEKRCPAVSAAKAVWKQTENAALLCVTSQQVLSSYIKYAAAESVSSTDNMSGMMLFMVFFLRMAKMFM